MVTNAIKFSASYVMPNPTEVDYWVDLNDDQYGSVIKCYDGDKWVRIKGNVDLGNIGDLQLLLDSKVDKVDGKTLSSNDYTNDDKTKLSNVQDNANYYLLPAATKTTLGGVKVGTGISVDIDGTITIPTYDLTGYALKTDIPYALPASDVYPWAKASSKPIYTKNEVGLSNIDNTSDLDKPISYAISSALENKVDKIEGKSLSTNDYTTIEKTKLAGIETNANNYVLTKTKVETVLTGDILSHTHGLYLTTHLDISGKADKATTLSGYGITDAATISSLNAHTNNTDIHIPTGAIAGQILKANSSGKATWVDDLLESLKNLTESMSYGVEWDVTQSTPDCVRVGNSLLHKSLPIQNGLRGCVANGGNINYYLNANNWAFKEDGTTASVLDGTDGTVRVDTTTKFYGKGFSNGNKRLVRISTIKIDDTWVEIPRMVIDAYQCTVDMATVGTPKAVSVVNTTANFRGAGGTRSERDTLDSIATDLGKPRTNISRATMRTYSVNAGSEMMCYEWYKWIFYWLPVIEYATFNMQQPFNANLTSEGYHQGGLGPGVTTMDSTHWSEFNGYYPLTPCGYANDLGNFSGTKQFDVAATATKPILTMTIARYRGFDIFGDIWLNVDGIILLNDINSNDGNGNYILRNVYSTIDASKFADSITSDYKLIGSAITTEGYIKEFIIGNKAEIIPITIGGDTTKNKCDYTYCGSRTDTTLRTLLLGGNASAGASAGLGAFYSAGGVGSSYTLIGFRTLNKVVD